MSEFLALASAAMFGLGDFTGGFATRRLPVWTVMAWSQLVGLVVLAAGIIAVPASSVGAGDLGFGAVAGLAGLGGLALLYTALAQGTMSVVAPVTAATGASLPVAYDLATGARPSPLQWLGLCLGVLAVALLGIETKRRTPDRRSVMLALSAGTGFAVFFIALAQTDPAAGVWPVVAARSVSIPLAFAAAGLAGRPSPPRRAEAGLVAGAGLLDTAANVAVLAALQRGSLAISTVLSSLYPVFTAVAAVVVLRERPGVKQTAGIVLAVGAVAALAG
jgi:drug/metabolite transporter (DMT)-like permease